jgi:von Willebrand factor type A C-terminal domain/von Willebrand factor type A domain
MTTFTADVYQNEFLPIGGSEVNAVISVTSAGDGGSGAQLEAAEIVIVDTSGSMDVPRAKIKAAREATAAAVDCIRDGVAFAVIAGTDTAEMVYPVHGTLVAASEETREEAKRAARKLSAGGGTAIGSWLLKARSLFGSQPRRVCHAILLTDGNDEHETAEEFERALASCEGRFQCDCRGVGTDWRVSELRRVASVLLGSVELIRDPADMAGDFRSMMESAMGKATQSVSLRVWTPQGARVGYLKQVAPTVEDLTDRGVEVNALTADYPTGTWGEELRDYQLCVEVEPKETGAKMLAARVSLVEGDEPLTEAKMLAEWTDDPRLSTQINRAVAHYTGQAELADCIQQGLDARKEGDEATATAKLGRAVQLALESGNDGTLKALEAVVDVEDAACGTVRLREEVADVDEMALDTRSTKTVRVGPAT